MTIRLALAALLALLVFLTAYPLAMLVYGSLHTTPPGEPGSFNLDGYRAMLSEANARVLLNTVGLSLVKTGLAMTLALFLALRALPIPPAMLLLRADRTGFEVAGRIAGRASFVAAMLRTHALAAAAPIARLHLDAPPGGEIVTGIVLPSRIPTLLAAAPGAALLVHGGGRFELGLASPAQTDALLDSLPGIPAHACIMQDFAHQVFVLCGACRRHRIVIEFERSGDRRGHDRRIFIDRNYRINRISGRIVCRYARGIRGVKEVEREQAFRISRGEAVSGSEICSSGASAAGRIMRMGIQAPWSYWRDSFSSHSIPAV